MDSLMWKVYYNDKASDPVMAADVTDALDWAQTCCNMRGPVFISVVNMATGAAGMREAFPRSMTATEKAEQLIGHLAALGQDAQALRTIYQLGVEIGRAQAKGQDIDNVPLFLRRQAS
jgi:hypothetical protein